MGLCLCAYTCKCSIVGTKIKFPNSVDVYGDVFSGLQFAGLGDGDS